MIIITGCARSGTSLTTRIFEACGANLGPVNSLHENTSIRNGLIKKYLASIGADPKGQNPLPRQEHFVPAPEWRMQVLDRLNVPEPRAYKDAKICLMWPIWAQAFPEARWVIVRRDRSSIINSCMRTRFMNAYSDADGWSRWIDHHEERFREIMTHCNAREIWTLPFVPDDPERARPIVEWCGLEWKPDAVRKAIVARSL